MMSKSDKMDSAKAAAVQTIAVLGSYAGGDEVWGWRTEYSLTGPLRIHCLYSYQLTQFFRGWPIDPPCF